MEQQFALQVVFLICNLFVTSHAQYDGTSTDAFDDLNGSLLLTRIKRDKSNDCGSKLFERATDCCDIPMLLPLSAMQNCSDGFIQNDKQVVHMLGMSYTKKTSEGGKKLEKKSAKNTTMAANNTNIHIVSNYKNNTGGRLCNFECLFKGQGLSGSGTEGFDTAIVTTKFLAVVSPAWKPIVEAAITGCSVQIKGLNLATVTPPEGGKKCNPGPALLMSCIYKHNLMNCPAAVTFTGATCKDDLKKLKNCDVFAGLQK